MYERRLCNTETSTKSNEDKDKNVSEQDVDKSQQGSLRKRIKRDNMRILWKELQHEEKLGISDIKLTNKDEDRKVVEYINSHKSKENYAFSRKEISDSTGIRCSTLSYTTIIKIPTVRFILSNGELRFTTASLKERLLEFLKN